MLNKFAANETLNLEGKWPRSFYPTEENCKKCSGQLSKLELKRRDRVGERQSLLVRYSENKIFKSSISYTSNPISVITELF